jgi:CRISPR type III-A-associated RAMP protein Csm4
LLRNVFVSFWLWRVAPKGPLHFGESGIGLESTGTTMSADAFASALIAAAARASLDVAALIAAFEERRIRVSGLFPCAGETYLVPRPQCAPAFGQDAFALRKLLRRVGFLPMTLYERWYLRGEAVDEASLRSWLESSEKIVAVEAIQAHVALDRNTNGSNLYFVGSAYFHRGTGLYALTAIEDEKARFAFNNAAAALEVYGLGGERSAGHGGIVASLVPAPESIATAVAGYGDPAMLLSPFSPRADEDLAALTERGRYSIREIRGWVDGGPTGARRRRVVRVIAAGSLVPSLTYGTIVDIAPEGFPHRVVRCGTGFGLRISAQFLRKPVSGAVAS